MIKNRLAILLAERNIKITKVAKDTGISRNTVTSTAQNDGKMIQLQTIDVLCNYLGVTPNEFFEYYPAIYDLSVFVEKIELDPRFDNYELMDIKAKNIEIDIYMDFKFSNSKNYSVQMEGNLSGSNIDKSFFDDEDSLELLVLINEDIEYEGFIETFWKDLNVLFKNEIIDAIKNEVVQEIRNYLTTNHDDLIEELEKSDENFLDNWFNLKVNFLNLITR